jgi:hypothetical protein
MRVTSQAGRWNASCYTDGFPLSTQITDNDRPDLSMQDKRISLEDMRDLRYVLDRMIARLEPLDR